MRRIFSALFMTFTLAAPIVVPTNALAGEPRANATVTLRIYDPNWPDRDDVALTIHLDNALRPVGLSSALSSGPRCRALPSGSASLARWCTRSARRSARTPGSAVRASMTNCSTAGVGSVPTLVTARTILPHQYFLVLRRAR